MRVFSLSLYKFLFVIEHFLGKEIFKRYFGNYRASLSNRLSSNISSSDIDVESVKVDGISEVGSQILLLKGGAQNWDAVKNWSLDYFKENYGDKAISINNNVGIVDKDIDSKLDDLTVKSFIQEIERGSHIYLKLSDLVHREPSLSRQLDLNYLKLLKP